MNAIIKWALQNRLIVVAIAALLLVWGGYVAFNLPVDVFPDLNKPTITILTEAEGLAPEEVETQVSYPIETVMNGVPGVTRVRSQSGIGLSIVYVEFDWGTDIYRNRQLVAEKITEAREQLPVGVSPFLAPISSIMGEIMLISITSEGGKTSPLDVRTLADWTVRPRLLTITGVSQVIPIGGGVKQYQALVSPEKLKQFGVTIEDVSTALEKSNSNSTGGFVDAQSQEVRKLKIELDVIGDEFATLAEGGGAITHRFRARDLNLVLAPPADGRPVRFRVRLDGATPGADHGFDTDAQGWGRLDTPRMYQLVRQSGAVSDRTFQIEFLDAGARAYAFTFG